jgi:hypothetical protein
VRDKSVIDGQDRLLLGEGCSVLSIRVSLGVLALRESPRGHEIFHHYALFELMFDGLHMVQAGLFDKFLEVVIRLLRLTLEVTLIDHDVLLVGAARFLVGVVVASSNYDPLGVLLFPIFATFGAFAGGFG